MFMKPDFYHDLLKSKIFYRELSNINSFNVLTLF